MKNFAERRSLNKAEGALLAADYRFIKARLKASKMNVEVCLEVISLFESCEGEASAPQIAAALAIPVGEVPYTLDKLVYHKLYPLYGSLYSIRVRHNTGMHVPAEQRVYRLVKTSL